MKKIIVSAVSLAFLLGTAGAFAQVQKEKPNFAKPLKVRDFKIEKKLVISEKDRQAADELLKGKPAGGSSSASGKTSTISATGILGDHNVDSSKKFAIVIGLSNYAGTINDLCINKTDAVGTDCADGDSLNMQKALKGYGFQDGNIHMFRDDNTNFAAIQAAVADIVATAGSDSEIVFFFSGHSATADDNAFGTGDPMHVGLALYNANGGEIIWDQQLKEWFSAAKTSRVAFIFDTCHAGGLESYLKIAGREVIMSSTEKQYSYTYSLGGPNGPGEGMFAHYFVVAGASNKLADGYNALKEKDGLVAAEEAYEFSKKYVPLATSKRQTPVIGDSFFNDLLL